MAFTLDNLGGLAFRHGDLLSADSYYQRATAIRQKLTSRYPLIEQHRRRLIISLQNYSAAQKRLGNEDKSTEILDRVILACQLAMDDFPQIAIYRRLFSSAEVSRAAELTADGDDQEAVGYCDRVITRVQELIDQSVEVPGATRTLYDAD